ncbi:MAG: hypothetical protein JWP44_5014 [Mucilaginibacter sp.]|nr:hypothetical protein [Mucilaginibacter sp.]
MAKKNKGNDGNNIVQLISNNNGIPTPQELAKAIDPVADMAHQKKQFYDNTMNELLTQHKEKGSLAFEILKSVLNQNHTELMRGEDFEQIVKNAYNLADVFKQEMDFRWKSDVDHVTAAIYGQQPENDAETAGQPAADVEDSSTIN